MADTKGSRKPNRSPEERRRWLSAQFDSRAIERDVGINRVYVIAGGRDNMKSAIYDDVNGIGGSVRGNSVMGGYPLSDYSVPDRQLAQGLIADHAERDKQCARDVDTLVRSAAHMMDLQPGDVVLLPTFGNSQGSRDKHLVDGKSIALGAPSKLNAYIAGKDGVERHAWCNVTRKFNPRSTNSYTCAVFDRARKFWPDHELCVVAFPEAWNGLDTDVTLWKGYDADKSNIVQLHEHFNTRPEAASRVRNVSRLLETLDTCHGEHIPCYAVGNRGAYVQLLAYTRVNEKALGREMDMAKTYEHKHIITDLGVSTDVDEMLAPYFANRIAPMGDAGETVKSVDLALADEMAVSVPPTSVPGVAPVEGTGSKVVVRAPDELYVDDQPFDFEDGEFGDV